MPKPKNLEKALTKCKPCKKDSLKFDGVDQSEHLVENSESVRDEFLINIDPLIHSPGNDHRKWNSTFDVQVRAGLR